MLPNLLFLLYDLFSPEQLDQPWSTKLLQYYLSFSFFYRDTKVIDRFEASAILRNLPSRKPYADNLVNLELSYSNYQRCRHADFEGSLKR